ncbi:MAG: glycosyl hydrolase [Paludibacter sp.]
MKPLFRYTLFLACLYSFVACNTQNKENGKAFIPSDKKASTETVELFSALQTRMANGVMLGHQDDLAYGNKWFGESGRSDVKSVCGDYPAVFGWNLGNIEKDSIYNTDSISFSKLRQYIKAVDKINGISVLSWCSNNSMAEQPVGSILQDPTAQKQFVGYLDKIAGFFNSLKDNDGNFIPVIFQPFNEYNVAGKYWWSTDRCSASEYKKLWAFTVDYLRDAKKIHHVLYSYSIHAEDNANAFNNSYPGNEYVDLVGVSLNLNQDEDPSGKIYVRTLNSNLSIITQFAEKNNKIAALTNTGMEGIKIPDYFSNYLFPIVSQYKLSYIMFGKNAWNDEKHYFIPVPGHPASEDFLSFSKNPRILTSSKIN